MLELTYFWFRNSGPNLPMWCHQNPVLVKVNSGDHADFFSTLYLFIKHSNTTKCLNM